jgi:hypothetical protein
VLHGILAVGGRRESGRSSTGNWLRTLQYRIGALVVTLLDVERMITSGSSIDGSEAGKVVRMAGGDSVLPPIDDNRFARFGLCYGIRSSPRLRSADDRLTRRCLTPCAE